MHVFKNINVLLNSFRETKSTKGKLGRFLIGFGIYQLTSKGGALLINPIFIWLFEIEMAFTFMVLFSIFMRYFLVKLYDNQKIDWFFLEELKKDSGVQIKNVKGFSKLLISLLSLFKGKIGRIFNAIVLILWDPSLIAIYIREGHNSWNGFQGLLPKLLFFLSANVCALLSLSWEAPIIDFLKNILSSS